MVLGIDASRNRSGGAVAHLIGILGNSDFKKYGISEVHIWSYKGLLDQLPNIKGLVKHNPNQLSKNILIQLYWQRYLFPKELKDVRCNIVFNTDAGSIGNFSPSISMSQDMLSYEPGEMKRLKWGKERIRLLLLYFIQNRSLKKSVGVIFLTNYASTVIQRSTGEIKNFKIIPHGVHNIFKNIPVAVNWPYNGEREIRCIYVSNTALYKHQWHVVRAISILRKEGFNINLTLIGGGAGISLKILQNEIAKSDPDSTFIKRYDFIQNDMIPNFMSNSDIFLFASSCENMPITLIEGMNSGLPIVCSDRGPMPEVLRNGGVYFDPENPDSIANALRKIILNKDIREESSTLCPQLAAEFSWKRCSDETFEFITRTFLQLNK